MILFLGAGASRPFGIPVMSEFIHGIPGAFSGFNELFKDTPIYMSIRDVFPDNMARPDHVDLEVILTVLSDLAELKEPLMKIAPHTAHFLLSQENKGRNWKDYLSPDSQHKAGVCLREVKKVVRSECLGAVATNPKIEQICKVYDAFFQCLAEAYRSGNIKTKGYWEDYIRTGDSTIESGHAIPLPLRVFTTNYDTCLETYFLTRQTVVNRGVTPFLGAHSVLDVGHYGEALLKSDEKLREIHIYKLHGSVDLYREEGQVHCITPTLLQSYELNDKQGDFTVYPIESSGYQHVISSPYLEMLHYFHQYLGDTALGSRPYGKLWFIIGFSFRDATIVSIMNNVIRSIATESRKPDVFVIDRQATAIKGRLGADYRFLADRIRPVDVEFGDFGKSGRDTNWVIAIQNALISTK